jgi:rhamnose transport system substrate-binding protein
LVVKSLENPYMSTMYDGFRNACDELGATALLFGPGANASPDQARILLDLIDQGADAIAVAANDMEGISPMLQRAKAAGIPIVSLDSKVKPDERIVHIQQTSPEMIGRVLIQACALMIGAEGDFAILSTTDSMPNQASWVGWMQRELAEHPEQYAGMRLVEIAYGLDQAEPSAEAARRLLADYPGLKAIVAPTVVGLRAAAEEIARAGSPVKLTGLGLPSDMETYIMNGICPWMYLWNPAEVGYLAAYAMDAIVAGRLKGELGETLHGGSLGDKVVTRSEDGGFEIVLGYPKVFDMTNIAVWGELF